MTNPLDPNQEFFVFNNNVLRISEFDYSLFNCSKVLYEVIKVINNAPLFFAEHIERLRRSSILAGFEPVAFQYITEGVRMLLEANPVVAKNIRISLCYSNPSKPVFLCYYVESSYPTGEQYIKGVQVEILQEVRNNPNIKADNPSLRSAADAIIKSHHVYETILVNPEGYVTECSRSNFFAVSGNKLVTPPAEDVLEGITRMKVIELAKANQISCIERKIFKEELSRFDAAFITGTSRGVLPLNAVGEYAFDAGNSIVQKIIELYNAEVKLNLKNWGRF